MSEVHPSKAASWLRVSLLLPVLMLLDGCFVTKLEAPADMKVRLLSRDEPAKFKKEYKNFYLLYGFVPLWPTQPEEIIKEEGLVEARAQTRDTVSDAVITSISMLFPLAVFPQHVVVEGNRLSDLKKTQAPNESYASALNRSGPEVAAVPTKPSP